MHYQAPTTLTEAVALLAASPGPTRLLAGGTDLLVQLRTGRVAPELVVDLKRIPALGAIEPRDGGFRIGGAVASARLSEHAELRALWPGVVEAMALVGSDQIQERATLAGNLCNASPAADSVPALMAARATVSIQGPEGARECPVGEIVTGPGRTSLGDGEIVEWLYLPPRPARAGDAYLRFIPRTEMDIAVAGAAVNLELKPDGTCRAAQIVLGAVAPTPIRVPEAEAALVGTALDATALAKAADACSAACDPIDDKRGTATYRRRIAGVLARRAAGIARQRAEERA